MTATNHALTGAIVAAAVATPLAIPLAFAAHFAMDAIPHFGVRELDVFKKPDDRLFRTVLVIDSAVGLIALIFVPIILHSFVPLWLCFFSMFACMSPDLVWGWRYYHVIRHHTLRKRSWFSRAHKTIQWSETPNGAVIEFAWFFAALIIISIER